MSTGQKVGYVVGGAIGMAFGNPMLGAQIGGMVGGYVDPPDMGTTQGPRLDDLSVQTSSYGANLPKIYGSVAVSGNVFWLKGNQIDEVIVKKKSGGSKGQPSRTTTTAYYQATFAVSICDNEIETVSRIWLNGQLYYDAKSSDTQTVYSTGKNALFFDVYDGSQTTPCPEYEADVGVGYAPVYSGMSYIVFKDLPLERFGNRLPSVTMEVVSTGTRTVIGQLYDVEHDVNYENATGGEQNFGLPYIASVAAGAVEVTSTEFIGDVDTWAKVTFSIEGELIYIDKMPAWIPRFYFPYIFMGANVGSNQMLFAGALNDEKSALCTLDKAGASSDLLMSDLPLVTVNMFEYLSLSPIIKPENYYHPTTEGYLRIATVSTDGKWVMVATGAAATGSETLNYWVFDSQTYDILYSGVSVDSHIYKSRGRMTVGGQRCSCVSEDGKYLWALYSYSVVKVFDLSDSMTEVGSYTLDSGAFASTIRPSIGEIGGTCFIVGRDRMLSISINELVTGSAYDVADIITDLCESSNIIESGDIDVSEIDETTIGYRVTGINSIRKNIEPLTAVYSFDATQTGYKIKFRDRETSSVKTISVDDLVLMGDTALKHNIKKETDLPRKLSVNYLDSDRNYDFNEQYTDRHNTESVNHVKYEFPVVMGANEAAKVSEKMLYFFWSERDEYEFILNASHLDAEAGDVITITGNGRDRLIKLKEIAYSGLDVVCKGASYNPRVYSPVALGESGATDSSGVVAIGKTIFEVLDIPIVKQTGNDYGLHFAAFGVLDGWSGATVFRSDNSGYSYDEVRSFGRDNYAFIGWTTNAPTGKKNTLSIDRETVLNVRMASGALYNVTEEHMLNGANYAIWGLDGRWEIIKFQRAELQSDGSYNVYNLCRGRSGTEWATSLHQPYDKFIIYDTNDVLFAGVPAEDIDEGVFYKAVTEMLDDSSATPFVYTYQGVNLKPFSPVWPTGSRDGSLNLTIGWTRRTRINGKWKNGRNALLSEASESYEVDIYNGSSVVRTLTSTTNEVDYTAAQQIADFGSEQSVVSCKIYQMSAAVGRGYELEANV